MYSHPLELYEGTWHIKEANLPTAAAGSIWKLLGKVVGAAGSLAGGAWAYNEIRKALRGPEYQHNVQIFPMYGSLAPNPNAPSAGVPSFGYAVPGALAGAALGGLLGQNWNSAAIGGLAGGGLGYFLGRYLNANNG